MGGFGARLKAARLEAGLKQTVAADAVGVTQSAISQYENDLHEPPMSVLVGMAMAYGCTTDYLCMLVDERDAVWHP